MKHRLSKEELRCMRSIHAEHDVDLRWILETAIAAEEELTVVSRQLREANLRAHKYRIMLENEGIAP